MDNLDRNIIIELHNDCRISFSSLARTFGVTTATIMNRIDKIQNRDHIFSYRLSINLSAIGGKKFLIFFEPTKEFDLELLEKKIERYCLIDSYGVLLDDRYFLYIWCLPTHNFEQLETFLESFLGIRNMDLYMLDTELCKKRSLTQMEVQIINHLFVNPRMKSTSIASIINGSNKGVRKAIRRLSESSLVDFTLHLHLNTLMIRISILKNNTSLSYVVEWMRNNFSNIINIETASKERVVFIFLILNMMEELSSVIEIIKSSPFANLSEVMLYSYLKYNTSPQEMIRYFALFPHRARQRVSEAEEDIRS